MEEIVSRSADAIVDVTRDITTQSLDATRSYADDARSLLDRAVDKSLEGMDRVEARAKVGMEKANATLQQKTAAEKQKLHEVGEGIKEFAESRTQR